MVNQAYLQRFWANNMAAKHGTRRAYVAGCRCDDCKEANRVYQQEYQARRRSGETGRVPARVVALSSKQAAPAADGPGAVERGVSVEIEGLAQAEARPGLAETALALARILDNPRAISQQPAASKSLAEILDRLRRGADVRKSRLASVRAMTSVKSAG